jgi:hypothetical protein
LITDAHPLVQITLMRQKDRQLMHFVNLTGHADTAYFKPIPVREINVRVKGAIRSANALRSNRMIAVKNDGGYSEFTLPALDEYELVHLR